MSDMKEPDRASPTDLVGAAGSYSTLTLDVELYQGLIDDPSLSDADKRALVETLWSIMVSFVDLGFGIHPLQQAASANALDGETGDKTNKSASDDRTPMLSTAYARTQNEDGASIPREARHDT